MTKNTKNLSIRVKLPEDENPRFQVQEEVTILWDRVIAALLLISLAIGLTLIAIQYFKGVETIEAPLKLEPAAATESETPKQSLQLLTEVEVKETGGAVEKLAVVESEETLNTAKEETKPIEKSVPALGSSDKALTTADTATKNEGKPNYQANTQPAPQEKPAATVATKTEAPLETAEPAVASRPEKMTQAPSQVEETEAEVKILSGRVNEAVLTTKVNGRAPGPKATSQLTIPQDDLLTVYFVTELKGNKGQPVFFNWYRNDNPAAKVRISPKRDTAQIMSSKYINKDMTGKWRVELVSNAGETLAESAFVVINDSNRG